MDRNGEFFIEMARDETHGDGSWSFQSCVFAPTEKRGGGEWKFWSTIGEVKPGDVILHLRGKPPNAQFVGYSLAASGGRRTDSKPPDAGAWSYSGSYFKADLTDFTPFQPVINLADVFKSREQELREYFAANRSLADEKLPIFFVVQSDRLQCLNGAYFSKGDNNLLEALFGDDHSVGPIASAEGQANVNTGEGVATLRTRIGQRDFSLAVKANYSNRCCFPNCPIDDPRFLVASHIARWSDTPSLRGNLRNGLCLCVFHDKAFEIGVYTLDGSVRVYVNPSDNSKVANLLKRFSGASIRKGRNSLSPEALLEHWIRVGIDPVS